MYKSFYEQVFMRFHKSLQELPSSIGSAMALLQGKQGYSSLHCGVLTRFAVKEFYSYESFNTRKKKNLVPTSYLQEEYSDLPSSFCPTIRSIQGKRRIFMRQATYKGSVLCVLNQEFLFLVHKYWGSEVTRLGWSIGSYKTNSTRKPCAKSVLETDYLMQQKQYHKRTNLRTMKIPLQSICSKEGPHYCLSKARESCHLTNDKCNMAWVRLGSCCEGFRSEECPHYHLGAKRKEAVIWQATINLFTSLDILWCFHTRAVLRSLANARKCQLKDFCKEERYESCSVQQTFPADTFCKRRKRENSMVVKLLPGSHEHLVLRNPHVLFQKHGGACTM